MNVSAVNVFKNQSVISGFGNTIICTSNADEAHKVITVPKGYSNTDTYVTIKVLFINSYSSYQPITTPMTLAVKYDDGTYFDGSLAQIDYPVKSYQYDNGVYGLRDLKSYDLKYPLGPRYVVMGQNTYMELYFDGTQFVVVGNPVLLHEQHFNIFADGISTRWEDVSDDWEVIYQSTPLGNLTSNVIK